jgi:hypothetical protein
LFSNAELAEYINQHFEPVWESMRPVPLIRIDFGNGNALTRTLRGNIATYVCTAQGQVLDVIPALYTPGPYRAALEQLELLHRYVHQPDRNGTVPFFERLRHYHQRQAAALKRNQPPPRIVMDVTKSSVEYRLADVATNAAPAPLPERQKPEPLPTFDSPDDLASWRVLAEDTERNQTIRRLQIHVKLAEMGAVLPLGILSRWVYKEVLHADLDDPYLGLGQALFANYPFTREEAAHRE